MTTLNEKQIEAEINDKFKNIANRKIVFWYDAKGEFLETVKELHLENAKLYMLEENEFFKAKVQLEIEDRESNYLVYAPFEKPKDENNHLLSIQEYNPWDFHADAMSMLVSELGIDKRYTPIFTKHEKFFAAKDRRGRFTKLLENKDSKEQIEKTLISACIKGTGTSLGSILQKLFVYDMATRNKAMDELKKYNLIDTFWSHIEREFGKANFVKSIKNLVIAFFIDYINSVIGKENLPIALEEYVFENSTGVSKVLLDDYMNDKRTSESYESLSEEVYGLITEITQLDRIHKDLLVNITLFKDIDIITINWIVDRLKNQDVSSKLNGMNIYEVIEFRRKMHFGDEYKSYYSALKYAANIIKSQFIEFKDSFKALVLNYQKEYYLVDLSYRKFIYNFRKIENREGFKNLSNLVENIYSKVIDSINKVWNSEFEKGNHKGILDLSRNFYNREVKGRDKGRLVVIISDALRYEVAKELEVKINRDPKATTNLKSQLASLPSITEVNMISLLPHSEINVTQDRKFLLDGKSAEGTLVRDKILKSQDENSMAITYKEVFGLNKSDIREKFKGKQIVYLYHDKIDAIGDKAKTEDDVFNACKDSIWEIESIIKKIAIDLSISHFIVTSDHGFIYKHGKVEEHNKINNPSTNQNDRVERRFVLSTEDYKTHGTSSITLKNCIGSETDLNVIYPITTNIFKKVGGGQKFVHGGNSIQEMLVPVLDVKMSRESSEREPVVITLMNQGKRLTNLNVNLELYQKEVVGSVYKPSKFRIYFINSKNQKISGEVLFTADSEKQDAIDRLSKVNVSLVNRHYRVDENYALVIENIETGKEDRYDFVIDYLA